MSTFDRAPFLWWFYKGLDFVKKTHSAIIAQEIYCDTPVSEFIAQGRVEAYHKQFIDEHWFYNLPKNQDLESDRIYKIPDSLLLPLIKEKGSISDAFCYLLAQPDDSFCGFLDELIGQIERECGWETKIINPDGSEVKRGEVGELCVKGPGVMLCYYNDKKSTDEVLKDGWLLTGDVAQEDEDGFIYLVDRAKDVIISGGENIYPVQIEDFLRKNDAIKDVAVIGLPDHRLGEITAAIIELKPNVKCTEDDINEFCLELPRYKRPRKIIFADVPRNPTGKIEKPKLREIYCGESLVKSQIEN